MSVPRLCLILLALAVFNPAEAKAHALQPGYLEITTLVGDSYRVYWRRPDVQGAPMDIDARLPETCQPTHGPPARFDGTAWVSAWVATCPDGLAGRTITIEGLERQQNDVLVRYPSIDGQTRSERLTADRPLFVVPVNPGAFDVFRTYLPLGVEHILAGLDHLLFVFALLLLITNTWRLIGAITAFTIAHSMTMALATLGWVMLPGPPVEAVIALSIMFVASELAQRDGREERLSERYPWSVSFAFGLLHGFGFADALRDIGLPPSDVPLTLLAFNLGVELGQLLFVAAVLLAGAIFHRILPAAKVLFAPGRRPAIIGAYAIGGISAIWFIDRVSSF